MFNRSAIATRRAFGWAMLSGLRLAWPILSALILIKVTLGVAIGALEHWGLANGVYFAFITGLTIGYGDFVPTGAVSKMLAIIIGVAGTLFTGLLVALAVRAFQLAAPLDKGDGQ